VLQALDVFLPTLWLKESGPEERKRVKKATTHLTMLPELVDWVVEKPHVAGEGGWPMQDVVWIKHYSPIESRHRFQLQGERLGMK
jgi:hypothetical protein